MGKKRNKFYDSAKENNKAFAYYMDRFQDLALSLFEWEDVPETVDPRAIEVTLFNRGVAVFFEDEDIGPLCLPVIYNGPFNVYGYPTGRRAVSYYNHYTKELTTKDSVLVYNNMLHTNTYPVLRWFAQRLWQMDRTVDININAQKTPILIKTPESQRLTVENLYMQYEGNCPVIVGDKGLLQSNEFGVLQTGAPFVADKVYQTKVNIFNEALTFLGIPNMQVQKKERLLSDEVHRDMGGTIASRYSRVAAREEACRLINKKFGLDMSVRVRGEEELESLVKGMSDSLRYNVSSMGEGSGEEGDS